MKNSIYKYFSRYISVTNNRYIFLLGFFFLMLFLGQLLGYILNSDFVDGSVLPVYLQGIFFCIVSLIFLSNTSLGFSSSNNIGDVIDNFSWRNTILYVCAFLGLFFLVVFGYLSYIFFLWLVGTYTFFVLRIPRGILFIFGALLFLLALGYNLFAADNLLYRDLLSYGYYTILSALILIILDNFLPGNKE